MKRSSFVRSLGLATAVLLEAGITLAHAAPFDGQWKGTLQCSALTTDPVKSPAFSAPVSMTVSGKNVAVVRDTDRVHEEMNGSLSGDGSVILSGPGTFKNGSGTTWNTRLAGKFTGERFSGKGGIYSVDGMKWRDCNAETMLAVAAPQAAPVEKPQPVAKQVPQANGVAPAAAVPKSSAPVAIAPVRPAVAPVAPLPVVEQPAAPSGASGLPAIERRDFGLQEEADKAKRAEEEKLRVEREAAERARAIDVPRQPDIQPETADQTKGAEIATLLKKNLWVLAALIALGGIIGLIGYVLHLRRKNASTSAQVGMALPTIKPEQTAMPQAVARDVQVVVPPLPPAQPSSMPPLPPKASGMPPPLPSNDFVASGMPDDQDHMKRLLIGRKADYYMERWGAGGQRQNKMAMNSAAFLFSCFWMAYRKMYGSALVFTVVSIAIDIFRRTQHVPEGYRLLLFVACGLLGDWLYKKHIEKKLVDIRGSGKRYSDAEISKMGGTSIGGLIAFVVFFVVVFDYADLLLEHL